MWASRPNFLDVGGGATSERVTAAFQLILSNPRVRAVAGQYFRRDRALRPDRGRGDQIAVKNVGVKVPVGFGSRATNADKAREMLATSGLTITGCYRFDRRCAQDCRAG